MTNYVQIDDPTARQDEKHIAYGRIAVLTDAIGPRMMNQTMMCHIQDREICTAIAHVILMLDADKWVRSLPSHADACADPHTIQITPEIGVNIVFDRHIMTPDGFVLRKDYLSYQIGKVHELMRVLSSEDKLFVMEQIQI